MAKLAKQILKLIEERDRYKQHVTATDLLNNRLTAKMDKQNAALEALYFQRENSTAAIIAEHMGPKWGVNLEMKATYSAPLKQQLEVKWPINVGQAILTVPSSLKNMNLDGGPPGASGEKMKDQPGCDDTSSSSGAGRLTSWLKTPKP